MTNTIEQANLTNKKSRFFFSLIGFLVLDVVLLLWLLNPLSSFSKERSSDVAAAFHPDDAATEVSAAKPSPLGPVVKVSSRAPRANRAVAALN